ADGGEAHGDADQHAAEGGVGDRGAGGRERVLEEGHEDAGGEHEEAEAGRLDRVLRPVAGHRASGSIANRLTSIVPRVATMARMVIPATRAVVNTIPGGDLQCDGH